MRILLTSIAVFSLCLGVSFAKTSAERYEDEMAKYKRTDMFEKCIRHNSIKRTKVLDDTHIIFEMRNGQVYLNTLTNNCRPLGFTRQFAVNVRNNRLCDVDFISVLDSMTSYGSCGLGKFELLEELPDNES